jgi:hypothetical protein
MNLKVFGALKLYREQPKEKHLTGIQGIKGIKSRNISLILACIPCILFIPVK